MITFFICSQPTITGRHTDYLKVLMHLIIMDRQSGQGFGRWRQSVTWWICMDSSMNSHPWGGLGVPGQSNQYPSIFVLFLTLPLIGVSLYQEETRSVKVHNESYFTFLSNLKCFFLISQIYEAKNQLVHIYKCLTGSGDRLLSKFTHCYNLQ